MDSRVESNPILFRIFKLAIKYLAGEWKQRSRPCPGVWPGGDRPPSQKLPVTIWKTFYSQNILQNFLICQAGFNGFNVGGDPEGTSRVKHLAALESGIVDRGHEWRGRFWRPQLEWVSVLAGDVNSGWILSRRYQQWLLEKVPLVTPVLSSYRRFKNAKADLVTVGLLITFTWLEWYKFWQ